MFFRHVSEKGDVRRDFLVQHVSPLGLADFTQFLRGKRRSFKARMDGVVDAATDLPRGASTSMQATIDFNESVPYFALVLGGVLPPPFVLPGTGLLLDRNVVSNIAAWQQGAVAETHPLGWLNSEAYTVNSILGALEGTNRRAQSLPEFLAEFARIEHVISRCLPRARRIHFTAEGLETMHRHHTTFAARATREATFLRDVAQRLANPVKRARLAREEQAVLAAADRAQLRRGSAVVLTALAKLYEGETDRPAGNMLKLAAIARAGSDWDSEAYNAVSDVRQLEHMATAATMPHQFALLTGDKGLSQVWCGLRPQGRPDGQGTILIDFVLDPALFPRLIGSVNDLLRRMLAEPSSPPDPAR
jgi:hypothetical protein